MFAVEHTSLSQCIRISTLKQRTTCTEATYVGMHDYVRQCMVLQSLFVYIHMYMYVLHLLLPSLHLSDFYEILFLLLVIPVCMSVCTLFIHVCS